MCLPQVQKYHLMTLFKRFLNNYRIVKLNSVVLEISYSFFTLIFENKILGKKLTNQDKFVV